MRALLILAFALLAAPALALTPEEALREAKPQIETVNDGWVEHLKAGDLASALSAYADDAVLLMPDGRSFLGRAAIEAEMARRLARVRLTGGKTVQEGITAASGELIYEWGRGETESVVGDRTVRSSGRYLTVWRRAPDGRWRIIRNLPL